MIWEYQRVSTYLSPLLPLISIDAGLLVFAHDVPASWNVLSVCLCWTSSFLYFKRKLSSFQKASLLPQQPGVTSVKGLPSCTEIMYLFGGPAMPPGQEMCVALCPSPLLVLTGTSHMPVTPNGAKTKMWSVFTSLEKRTMRIILGVVSK